MQQDRSRQVTWVLAGIAVLLVAVFAVLAAYTFTRDHGGDSADAAPVTVTVTSTPAEQPAPQPAPSPIAPPSIAAPPVTGPPATVPTPADEGFCGAHTSPWNCWSDVSPAGPGEIAFINQRLQFDIPGIPTDRTRLLQISRGICQSLNYGTSSNNIVTWLAEDLGASEGHTGQVFIMATETACA